jgi:crotonobetainyl-CoA:carnitine CoA-transferase CaiB-like acyl-CoA transferase
VNRHKRSVCIDLKAPGGPDLVRRLAARADVVIDNFKVGDLARYGLDAASAAGRVAAAGDVFDHRLRRDRPAAAEPGYDAAVQALSGVMAHDRGARMVRP